MNTNYTNSTLSFRFDSVNAEAITSILPSPDTLTAKGAKEVTPLATPTCETFDFEGKECRAIPENYRGCAVSFKDFKIYVSCGQRIIDLFGEEIVKKNLPMLSLVDITTSHKVDADQGYHMASNKDYYVSKKPQSMEFEVFRGTWTKKENRMGVNVLIPSPYQSAVISAFMHRCLLDKYDWLNNFEFEAYAPSYGERTYEFYVKIHTVEEVDDVPKAVVRSLYVPIEALEEKDPKIIENRMTDYFTKFYVNRPELAKKNIDICLCAETQLFFQFIRGEQDCSEGFNPYIPQYSNCVNTIETKYYGKNYGYVLSVVRNGYMGVPETFTSFKEAYIKMLGYFDVAIKTYDNTNNPVTGVIHFEKGHANLNLGVTKFTTFITRVEIKF